MDVLGEANGQRESSGCCSALPCVSIQAVPSPKCIPDGPHFNMSTCNVGSGWEPKVALRREDTSRNVPLRVERCLCNCSASKPPRSFFLPRNREMDHARMNIS